MSHFFRPVVAYLDATTVGLVAGAITAVATAATATFKLFTLSDRVDANSRHMRVLKDEVNRLGAQNGQQEERIRGLESENQAVKVDNYVLQFEFLRHGIEIPKIKLPKLKSSVLLVEDHLATAVPLTAILKRCGCEVSSALNVQQTIERLSERNYDYILLDLMLPDANGVEVLRWIRSNGVSSKVCVISACIDDQLNAVMQLAPDMLFKKPFDTHALLAWLASPEIVVAVN